MSFFTQMGPLQYPMMLIAVAVVGLIVWRAMQLGGVATPGPELEAGVNGILFWGVVAAMLGFLGFFSGVYLSLSSYVQINADNPKLVMAGTAESLAVSIFGLCILIVATIGWFALRSRYRKMALAAC